MSSRVHIDPNALLAARENGASMEAIGDQFGCSRSTIERRLLALQARGCRHCALHRDAEVMRLRDAYILMEEALLAFLGANRPGDVGRQVDEVEYGKGLVSESSSSAAPLTAGNAFSTIEVVE